MHGIVIVGNRAYFGELGERSGEHKITVHDALLYSEMSALDENRKEIKQPAMSKPFSFLRTPKKVELYYDVVFELNEETPEDRRLIAYYKDALKHFIAIDSGIVIPNGQNVVDIGRRK